MTRLKFWYCMFELLLKEGKLPPPPPLPRLKGLRLCVLADSPGCVNACFVLLQGQRNRVLSSFMLQDLRRFIMFDSSATRPYLVSAMSNWARAERLGYLTLDKQGKVRPVR